MLMREMMVDARFYRRPLTHAWCLSRYAAARSLRRPPQPCSIGGPLTRFKFEYEPPLSSGNAAGVYVLRDLCDPALAHLTRLLRPGDRALDAAAGDGLCALAMAALTGSGGRVLALERDPRRAEALRLNAQRNRFHQIEIKEGRLAERCDGEDKRARLDDLVLAYRFDRLDLVRLDALDGAAALRGGARALSHFQPILTIAAPDPASGHAVALRRRLMDLHYQCFAFDEDGALYPYGWTRPERAVIGLGPARTTATLTL